MSGSGGESDLFPALMAFGIARRVQKQRAKRAAEKAASDAAEEAEKAAKKEAEAARVEKARAEAAARAERARIEMASAEATRAEDARAEAARAEEAARAAEARAGEARAAAARAAEFARTAEEARAAEEEAAIEEEARVTRETRAERARTERLRAERLMAEDAVLAVSEQDAPSQPRMSSVTALFKAIIYGVLLIAYLVLEVLAAMLAYMYLNLYQIETFGYLIGVSRNLLNEFAVQLERISPTIANQAYATILGELGAKSILLLFIGLLVSTGIRFVIWVINGVIEGLRQNPRPETRMRETRMRARTTVT